MLARRHLVKEWTAGQYTGATDHTLGCSRSGLAVAVFVMRPGTPRESWGRAATADDRPLFVPVRDSPPDRRR